MKNLSRVLLIALAFILVSGVLPAGAADPQFYLSQKVDNSQGFDFNDEDMVPGQVEVEKLVLMSGADDGKFSIGLGVIGMTYIPEGAETSGFYPTTQAGITVVDVIGSQFKPVLPLNSALDYDAATNTITWVVSQEEVIEGVAVWFDVEFQDGWDLDVWYPTNAKAFATFEVPDSNPFFYTQDVVFGNEPFTIESFQMVGEDPISAELLDEVHGSMQFVFDIAGSTAMIEGHEYTLYSTTSAAPGSGGDGFYGFAHQPGAGYEIWVNGLDGAGTTTIFTIFDWYDYYAGDKIIRTVDPRNGDFVWDGDTIVWTLTNNGWAMVETDEVHEELPATGDGLSIFNLIALVGVLGLGANFTRKFK
jgi:hypothetical protein